MSISLKARPGKDYLEWWLSFRHGLADTILFDWPNGGNVHSAMGIGTSADAKSSSWGDGSAKLDRTGLFNWNGHLGRQHLVLDDLAR